MIINIVKGEQVTSLLVSMFFSNTVNAKSWFSGQVYAVKSNSQNVMFLLFVPILVFLTETIINVFLNMKLIRFLNYANYIKMTFISNFSTSNNGHCSDG